MQRNNHYKRNTLDSMKNVAHMSKPSMSSSVSALASSSSSMTLPTFEVSHNLNNMSASSAIMDPENLKKNQKWIL